MKQKSLLQKTLMLLAVILGGGNVTWAATTYEQLTSIANIDESAQYVLGIDGTGFHYLGTSSWGKTALPSDKTPIYYTLTKASDNKSFTAKATISGTDYYLQIPTSNTFGMATSTGTNTDIIIGTTQVSGTNYAVANKTTTARHLRINGTSGLRSYAGTTGTMAFFYKVVNTADFTLTATSNNADYGTVSVSGNIITASPATNCRVSTTKPYEVTEGEATVTQNGNVFTVTATDDCSVRINFEVIPSYAVTIETPTGGTLEVKKGDDVVTTGDNIAVGTELTVTATPDEGFKFKNWQAIDATTHTYTASNTGTYTMTENTVTFKANFDARVYYQVKWMVNGSLYSTDNYEEGDDVTFPSSVADIEGKTFVGWVDGEISGTTDDEPAFVTSATMGTETLTYYAVFADKTPGNSATKEDVLTLATTGVTSSNYTSWSGKTATSDAVYAGCSAKPGTDAIQLRSDKNESGIVTTASGGKLKKVSLVWSDGTASGRTLNIYGKNTAYTAASDLYDSNKQGTLLGTIAKGKNTTLTITGDYTFVGLRSNDGAMYLPSITIEWLTGTPDAYSDYCTTVAEDTRTAVNITGFSVSSAIMVKDEMYETSVTNDQEGWNANYIYTSDNTDVAEIDEDGIIYAYKKGSANVTATLNVDKKDATYKAGETRSITIAITVENPRHTVKFFSNGEEITEATAEVEEEADIEFPAAPTISGYNFSGWATSAIIGTSDEKPAVVDAATMGTSDMNFYAVYGYGYEENVTATFDASDVSNLTESTEYVRCWVDNSTKIELYLSAGSRYTSGTPNTWSVTKGTSNYFNIEIPSGKLKKIVTTIDKEKNSSYIIGGVSDGATLSSYDEDTETQIVTVNDDMSSVNCYATSDYQIRASKIDVEAVAYVFSAYMTTIPTTVSIAISSAKYATFCYPMALDFSGVEGLTAYKAVVSGNIVQFEPVASVPACEGVLLKGAEGTYAIPVAAAAEAFDDNAFIGVTKDTEVDDTGIFVLMDGDDGVGFYKTTSVFTVGAHTAYLPATSSARSFISFDLDDVTTGVCDVAAETLSRSGVVYTLQGQRVAKARRGLYIVDGKKTLVK